MPTLAAQFPIVPGVLQPATSGAPSVPATFVSGALSGVTNNNGTNTAPTTQSNTLNGPCPTKAYCVSFPGVVLSGNALSIKVFYGSSGTISSVTTDHSQTFTSAVTSSAQSSRLGQALYLCNATAGTHLITITMGTADIIYDVFLSEFAGPPSTSCLDASAAANGAATTTPAGGSVTPTQTGDIIDATFFKAGTPACTTNPCYTAGTGQSNITWALRGVDYQNGGAEQWGVYNSTTALNPTITDISSTYIGLTLAFKAANGGTSPTGMYPVYQTWCTTPTTSTATQKCQFPNSGNLVIVQGTGASPQITSIAQTGHTWVVPDGPAWADETGNTFLSGSGLGYVPNASADGSGQITVTMTNTGGSPSDFGFTLWDVAGAATVPFGARYTVGGNDTTTRSNFTYASNYLPEITDGLVFTNVNWANDTASTFLSPSGALFNATTWGGQQLSGPSTPFQNAGAGLLHNSTTTAQAWEVGFVASFTGGIANWAGELASFGSATGTFTGPSIIQSPSHEVTSGSTNTVTMASTQTGSTLVAVVGNNNSRTVTKICTDGTTCAGGNSFTKASSATCTAASVSAEGEIWYLTGHASGVTSVEATMSGATTTVGDMKVYEIRNITTLDVAGAVNSGAGVANLYTGPSLTMTGSPGIAVAILVIDNATGVHGNPSDGSLWGYDNLNTPQGNATGAIIAAAGTTAYSVVASGATNAFCAGAAAFK